MPEPKVEPSKTAPAEPGKEPEPKEPGKEPAKEPAKEPPKEPKEPDLLATKLEGDTVPEKFKGKTLGEVLVHMGTTDAELTKLQKENKQWQDYFKAKEEEAAAPREKPFNPVEVLGEEPARAVLGIMDARLKPVLDAVSGMTYEYAKSLYPDFEEHEEQIKKVYDEMIPEFKFNPKYGWPWAYRFVKAAAEGTPAPATAPLPTPGPSEGGVTPPAKEALTEKEKEWAEKMDMSEEDYLYYRSASKVKEDK